MSTVLAVADLHIPFTHRRYFDFISDVHEQWGCDRVVFIGDVIDHHVISRWPTEVDALNAIQEWNKAKKQLVKWHERYPNAQVCIGNHDERPYRVAAHAGIPDSMLRDLSDLYETPSWVWKFNHVIDGVLYQHGTGYAGQYATLNMAKDAQRSCVGGHTHKFGGVNYRCSSNGLYFALNVGVGMDKKKYAARYAKHDCREYTLGCGVVCDGKEAHFIPMS